MSKKTFDSSVVNLVDLLLFEEGVFSPLNWLLREAYIDYKTYQSWRLGDIAYLEDHFSKTSQALLSLLGQAYQYAQSQNCEASTQHYASKTGQQLYFSRTPANDIIFRTVFEPPQDQIQMDLFFDSALICTEFDLKKAIINKQANEIPRLLSQLKQSNLEKFQHFLHLINLEKKVLQSDLNSDKKIKCLQKTTVLAFEVFGRQTHEFITPLWHKVSTEIDGQVFNAKHPDIHLSYTASKGFLWPKVISSIEIENNWNKKPLLLFRYAEACFKLDKEQHGIATWFKLFILFPEEAEKLVKQSCNRILFIDWQSFCELEPELSTSLFPAWLVMNKAALTKNTALFEIKECDILQLIIALLINGNTEINDTVISQRAELQERSPSLFGYYMQLHPAKVI